MMYDLSRGPPAIAVRCVELIVVQIGYCGSDDRWKRAYLRDLALTLFVIEHWQRWYDSFLESGQITTSHKSYFRSRCVNRPRRMNLTASLL
jgi:hypothetical protein